MQATLGLQPKSEVSEGEEEVSEADDEVNEAESEGEAEQRVEGQEEGEVGEGDTDEEPVFYQRNEVGVSFDEQQGSSFNVNMSLHPQATEQQQAIQQQQLVTEAPSNASESSRSPFPTTSAVHVPSSVEKVQAQRSHGSNSSRSIGGNNNNDNSNGSNNNRSNSSRSTSSSSISSISPSRSHSQRTEGLYAGYLLKRPSSLTAYVSLGTWRRRWCVLHEDRFEWFAKKEDQMKKVVGSNSRRAAYNPNDVKYNSASMNPSGNTNEVQSPRGVLHFGVDCEVKKGPLVRDRYYSFHLQSGDGYCISFAADTVDLRDQWMDVIEKKIRLLMQRNQSNNRYGNGNGHGNGNGNGHGHGHGKGFGDQANGQVSGSFSLSESPPGKEISVSNSSYASIAAGRNPVHFNEPYGNAPNMHLNRAEPFTMDEHGNGPKSGMAATSTQQVGSSVQQPWDNGANRDSRKHSRNGSTSASMPSRLGKLLAAGAHLVGASGSDATSKAKKSSKKQANNKSWHEEYETETEGDSSDSHEGHEDHSFAYTTQARPPRNSNNQQSHASKDNRANLDGAVSTSGRYFAADKSNAAASSSGVAEVSQFPQQSTSASAAANHTRSSFPNSHQRPASQSRQRSRRKSRPSVQSQDVSSQWYSLRDEMALCLRQASSQSMHENGSKWDLIGLTNGCRLFRHDTEFPGDPSPPLLRSHSVVSASPAFIRCCALDLSDARKQWDPGFVHGSVLKKIDAQNDVVLITRDIFKVSELLQGNDEGIARINSKRTDGESQSFMKTLENFTIPTPFSKFTRVRRTFCVARTWFRDIDNSFSVVWHQVNTRYLYGLGINESEITKVQRKYEVSQSANPNLIFKTLRISPAPSYGDAENSSSLSHALCVDFGGWLSTDSLWASLCHESFCVSWLCSFQLIEQALSSKHPNSSIWREAMSEQVSAVIDGGRGDFETAAELRIGSTEEEEYMKKATDNDNDNHSHNHNDNDSDNDNDNDPSEAAENIAGKQARPWKGEDAQWIQQQPSVDLPNDPPGEHLDYEYMIKDSETSVWPAVSGIQGESTWRDSGAEGTFWKVRGPNYLEDRIKVPSAPSAMEVVAAKLTFQENPISNVIAQPGELVMEQHVGRTDRPFLLVLNFMVPTLGNFILYFARRRGVDYDPVFERMLREFVHGNDEFRNEKFKIIPGIVEGPWVVSKGVGNRPAILGKKIACNYYRGPNCFEIEIDVSSSRVAGGILKLVKGYTSKVEIDLAFLFESKEKWELPERIIGGFRARHPDLSGPG